jgi:hypothetical protein
MLCFAAPATSVCSTATAASIRVVMAASSFPAAAMHGFATYVSAARETKPRLSTRVLHVAAFANLQDMCLFHQPAAPVHLLQITHE